MVQSSWKKNTKYGKKSKSSAGGDTVRIDMKKLSPSSSSFTAQSMRLLGIAIGRGIFRSSYLTIHEYVVG